MLLSFIIYSFVFWWPSKRVFAVIYLNDLDKLVHCKIHGVCISSPNGQILSFLVGLGSPPLIFILAASCEYYPIYLSLFM